MERHKCFINSFLLRGSFARTQNLFGKGWRFMGIFVNRFYCRKVARVFVIAVLRADFDFF